MKKNFINILFQISALSLLISFFVTNQLDYEKLKLVLNRNLFLYIFFIIFTKILIASLFFYILNFISNKKNSYLHISSIFLQGGIVNQLIPGLGLLFKYYRLYNESDISLAQYSTSQVILSIFAILAYLLLALIFGIVVIENINFFNIFTGIILLPIIIIYGNKILYFFYKYIKKYLLKIKKIYKLIDNLSTIKTIIKNNKLKIILIFSFSISLAFIESISFYVALTLYGIDLEFVYIMLLFISTVIITAVSIINFIGFFEIIFLLSASVILSDTSNLIYASLGFKFLNIIGLITTIIIFDISKKIKNFFL